MLFLDYVQTVPGCVAAAKAQGANIIILLSHIGADEDVLLAAQPAINDIDLIIGGHSHTLFYTGTPHPLIVTPTIVAETTPVFGPYPTPIVNGAKYIPVMQALWASR